MMIRLLTRAKSFVFVSLLAFHPLASADLVSDAELILDWAESTYPELFPSNQLTQIATLYDEARARDVNWWYRYYPESDVYAGINELNEVATQGDVFGGLVVHGTVSEFIPLVSATTSTTSISLSGPDTVSVGNSLAVTDIAYNRPDLTGLDNAVIITVSLRINDVIRHPDGTFYDGDPNNAAVIVVGDSNGLTAISMSITVDGEKFDYTCTACDLDLNPAARTVRFNGAVTLSEVTGTDLVLEGSVIWTEADEVSTVYAE